MRKVNRAAARFFGGESRLSAARRKLRERTKRFEQVTRIGELQGKFGNTEGIEHSTAIAKAMVAAIDDPAERYDALQKVAVC